jgi:hypothetical protein
MTDNLQVHALGDHNYLIHIYQGEEQVEIRIQASNDVVQQLGLHEVDEPRIVEATAAFLIERQLAVDLPSTLDLDDVAAGYDYYFSELELRLTR